MSGGGRGVRITGVIVVRRCEPVFRNLLHSYNLYGLWNKWTHSYTWPSEMLTYSYNAVWFFIPIYCWIVRQILQSIHWTTREQAALKVSWKSLSKKYTHIPDCQKSGAFHVIIKTDRVSHILFIEKKGANHITGSAEKGGYSARTRTLPYIGRYQVPSPPPLPSPSPCQRVKLPIRH